MMHRRSAVALKFLTNQHSLIHLLYLLKATSKFSLNQLYNFNIFQKKQQKTCHLILPVPRNPILTPITKNFHISGQIRETNQDADCSTFPFSTSVQTGLPCVPRLPVHLPVQVNTEDVHRTSIDTPSERICHPMRSNEGTRNCVYILI